MKDVSNTILFYDRSWTWRIEYQAMRRALRWTRKGVLKVEYFHLPGSINVYQDQMVAHKRDATQAGLDWTGRHRNLRTRRSCTWIRYWIGLSMTLRSSDETTGDMRKLLKEAA